MIILNWILGTGIEGHGLYSSGSGEGQVVASCKHCNGHLDFVK